MQKQLSPGVTMAAWSDYDGSRLIHHAPGHDPDAPCPKTTLRAGVKYLRDIDGLHYQLFECLKDVYIAADDSFLAQPLGITVDQIVEPVGFLDSMDFERLIKEPATLATALHRAYTSPIHPLYDALVTPVLDLWGWSGRAKLTFPALIIEGSLTLEVRCGEISALLQIPRELELTLHKIDHECLRNGLLESLEAGYFSQGAVGSWKAEAVTFMSRGSTYRKNERGPQFSVIEVIVGRLNVVFKDDQPSMTRMIFEGSSFELFTQYVLKRETLYRNFPVPDAIHTMIFGRSASIYIPSREVHEERKQSRQIAVMYTGEPLGESSFEALAALLGYLKGRKLTLLCTERFSPAGRISYERIPRSRPSKQFTPPVPLGISDGDILQPIMDQFPAMLERLRNAIERQPNAIASILHNYALARDTTYPITSMTLMSVAIDSMISFVTGDSQSNMAPLSDVEFQSLLPHMQRALSEAFATEPKLSEKADSKEVQILLERKLRENFNNASNTRRLRAFWNIARVTLNEEEIALLRKRNDLIHKGYVRNELDSEILLETYDQAAQLTNLFNRGFLPAVLGYDGPVLDATTDGRKKSSRLRIIDGTAIGE